MLGSHSPSQKRFPRQTNAATLRRKFPAVVDSVEILQGELLVKVAEVAVGEVAGGLTRGLQDPLGGQQALDAHRPSGVDSRRADAHLRPWNTNQTLKLLFIEAAFR